MGKKEQKIQALILFQLFFFCLDFHYDHNSRLSYSVSHKVIAWFPVYRVLKGFLYDFSFTG